MRMCQSLQETTVKRRTFLATGCAAAASLAMPAWVRAQEQTSPGIDIANTFSRFYGISAPMVLDECESVNHPIYSGEQQQIRLKVTTDDELKFEYPSLAVME